MGSILENLFKLQINPEPILGDRFATHRIDVLSAVVDGLTPQRLFGEPQTGFSILYGPKTSVYSDLWNKEEFGSNVNQNKEASVTFECNPLFNGQPSLETTLPLANTMFQNGRRSTLLANAWVRHRNGLLSRLMDEEKRTQKIRWGADATHTRPLLPLLPLTPPRKIVGGLGNIVRQVEVDGVPTPASKELESLIPKVLDARSERDDSYSPGPIGVWCWVMPPDVADKLRDLEVFQFESSQSEAELSAKTRDTFSILPAHRCRLHKIRM